MLCAVSDLFRWRQFRCRATKKCIELSDYKFMYLEHGSASRERPTVLLLHGFTSGKEEWSEIMRLLGSACHVIAVDMPGHGETTRNPRGDHSIVGAVARVRQVSDFYISIMLSSCSSSRPYTMVFLHGSLLLLNNATTIYNQYLSHRQHIY